EAVDQQEDLANLPLAGVPVAVKENTAVAGLPTWYGSTSARAAVAEADHEVVRRLRGAGAVVVGTTRMPELGLWALTDDDTAIGLAVLAGWTPARLAEPGRLRIAVSARSPVQGVRADKPARDALRSAAKLVVGAGHDAVSASPRYPMGLGLRGLATWFAAAYRDAEESGVDRAVLKPRTRRHIAIGERT